MENEIEVIVVIVLVRRLDLMDINILKDKFRKRCVLNGKG